VALGTKDDATKPSARKNIMELSTMSIRSGFAKIGDKYRAEYPGLGKPESIVKIPFP